jgi:hypothetical protein
MYPINLSKLEIPKSFNLFLDTVRDMLNLIPGIEDTAFLTIDKKNVAKGNTQRRDGAHVDGNYTSIDGFDGPKWVRYNGAGGMLIVSSHTACKAWQGEFNGAPKDDGDCEHLRNQLKDGFLLKENTVYLSNSQCIHESLPVEKDINRTIIRITLPHNQIVL